jgi:hypothetical protein
MAVAHRLSGAQRAIQERREPVLVAARGERPDDLIQSQVGEELRLVDGGVGRRVTRVVVEDAELRQTGLIASPRS